MRRALLFLLALPLLAACSNATTPSSLAPHAPSIDVSNHQLVAYKRHTDVPDCPRTPDGATNGGMPSVTLPCLGGGRSVDVAGLRGPMIVNFWASWCTDCRKEMPALAAYAEGRHGVKVLGVDWLDQQPGAALELAQQSKVAYPLVADPNGNLDKARPLPHIPGLPLSVFLDANGRIAHIEAGSMNTEQDVADAVKKYLGVGG